MIKFFRKIRLNLINEGKTGKYLKYAIGEIILVVIGILIALQINNWNENVQQKKEELKTLMSLHEALKTNMAELDQIIQVQNLRNKFSEEFLFTDISSQSVLHVDSLITISSQNYTFNPSTGIYNSIVNSGKLEIITNGSLKNRLSKLNDIVKDYQEGEEEIKKFTDLHMENYFIYNFNFNPAVLAGLRERTAEEEEKDKAFYLKIHRTFQVQNMYSVLIDKMGDLLFEAQKLKSEYQGLIEDLEKEIKTMDKS